MKYKSNDNKIYEIETIQELIGLAINYYLNGPKDKTIILEPIEKGILIDENT